MAFSMKNSLLISVYFINFHSLKDYVIYLASYAIGIQVLASSELFSQFLYLLVLAHLAKCESLNSRI